MSLLGRKKHKKSRKQDFSRDRKYFDEIDDYEDEYEDDEYYGEDYEDDDMSEEYEGEEYYEDEESEEYEDDREYYEDEEPEEYEDDREYYEEEYYGDDVNYYGDEEYEEQDEDDEDDDLDYMEDGEYEDDDEDDDEYVAYRRKKGVAGALLAFRNLPLIDKVIAFTGVAVLFFAVLTGAVFMAGRREDKAVAAFAEVGTSLNGINIIGESGLLAVADAQLAKETAVETLEEEPLVVEELPVRGAGVSMKMTSIVKDLKIKFVNNSTEKLIANVPFEVEITAPGGKTETWRDDDKDGVIYKEDITAGTYKIKMVELTGYDDYTFSTETQSVEVKANIDYKKVDVKEEIKTEAEVNAAVEDTAIAEVVEESKLTDTVPFVKSTQTAGREVTYKAIDKSTIKDPATVVASAGTADYYLMTLSISENDPGKPAPAAPKLSLADTSVEVGKTVKIGVTQENVASIEWSSDNTSIATVDGNGNVTGVKEGTVTVRATGSGKDSSGTISTFCTVTVTAAPVAPTLKIDQTAVSMAVGESRTIKAESNQASVTWEFTDKKGEFADVAVAADGKTVTVKGKKAGTVTLTATVKDLQPQTCTVTITDSSITPDKTSLQVVMKKTAEINVKTVPESATITAESANKDIATVAVSGKKVTVTGVKVGDTTVTIKGSNGKEAKVTVKVVTDFENDTVSKLKDKDGKQVYVLENGKYREAVYADYYKANMQYFLQTTEILYTGWQNIDGKTYYYLENHKYVTGEQVIQGAKYSFASDGSLVTSSGTFGIDVSKWNGNIDWNSVKASGASYAIIRCGYRGSSTGALITDPKFAANISGANAAGLKVGVYFFTQAVNEKEAVEEASMVLDLVKKYKISYPIFLDVESSGGRADGIDKGTRTAVCKAFCATIQNSGYTAGVYANKTWLNSKIDAGALGSYKIWLAQYAAAPSYNGRYNLWQYSSKGSVPGISGNVDLNLSYLGY